MSGKATPVLELARFTVRPEHVEQMLALREPMTEALRRVAGFRGLTLVRLDERTWLDVVEWDDRASAEQALETVMSTPECTAFFGLIEQTVSMEHAEVVRQVREEVPVG